MDDLLTIREAAELIGIQTESLARLVYNGRVKSVQKPVPTEKARHMIRRADAERLRDRRTLPEGYITVTEAAERVGVSRQTMHSRNYSHLLESIDQGGKQRLAVAVKRLEAFIEERANVPA